MNLETTNEAQSEVANFAHLELHFGGKSYPHLERAIFYHPALDEGRVSVRAKSDHNQDVDCVFRWNQSVRTTCVLLLRVAQGELSSSVSMPGVGTVAALLGSTFASRQNFLLDMFGVDGEKPICSQIFRSSRSNADPQSVTIEVDQNILPARNISVFFNGERISDYGKIAGIADKIQHGVSTLSLLRTAEPEDSSSPLFPGIRAEKLRGSSLEVSSGMLSLLEPKAPGLARQILNSVSTQDPPMIAMREIMVILAQRVQITISEGGHCTDIRYFFDVANYGMTTFHQRSHEFWFEDPQEDVSLCCLDAVDRPIPFQVTHSTEHMRAIAIQFPNPINPADRVQYSVTFRVKVRDIRRPFYYMRARTLASAMSLTLIAEEGMIFRDPCVAHESADGMLRDDAPQITLTETDGVQRLFWESRRPKPGDLYRTFWSYGQRE